MRRRSGVRSKLIFVTMKTSDLLTFLGVATRHPRTVGAIAPSARALCRRLAQIVPSVRPSTVVELGAGTGAVSDAIRQRLQPGSRHIALEIDKEFATRLRRSRPDLEVINADATSLGSILEDRGVHQVDAIVSGLPWSLFPPAQQRKILNDVGWLLAPDAAFTTFAYLHALQLSGARRLRRNLHESFDEVITSRSVWWNAPPALTYVCRRPRQRAWRGARV
ncbi:methyltransferase domain-containing protein [Hamadaea sp.]|uniref:class I SAM-dependent methyltransferase n=1 Tax=Hamadaea sp. TaxID=2024425 RepID=UPI0025BDC228|nr:methyltransferase domain-containing protein [Hamadaea sp.]